MVMQSSQGMFGSPLSRGELATLTALGRSECETSNVTGPMHRIMWYLKSAGARHPEVIAGALGMDQARCKSLLVDMSGKKYRWISWTDG